MLVSYCSCDFVFADRLWVTMFFFLDSREEFPLSSGGTTWQSHLVSIGQCHIALMSGIVIAYCIYRNDVRVARFAR